MSLPDWLLIISAAWSALYAACLWHWNSEKRHALLRIHAVMQATDPEHPQPQSREAVMRIVESQVTTEQLFTPRSKP